jgi:hypothetical protein
MTPDPSGNNWDLADPQSWYDYSYANGDLVNSNDPNGLTACGDFVNGSNGRTIRSILTTYNDLGYLAQTIWHEAGPVYTSDIANINNFVTEQAWVTKRRETWAVRGVQGHFA